MKRLYVISKKIERLRNTVINIILHGGFYCFCMLLAINTCQQRVEVALIDGVSGKGKILYEKSEKSERDHAEKIFKFLEEALRKKSKMLKPEKILVVAGPGAFTSVRVGVVTANTIAFATRAHGNAAELYSIDLKTLFDQEEKKLTFGEAVLKIIKSGKLDLYEVKPDANGVVQAMPIYLKEPNISISKKEI